MKREKKKRERRGKRERKKEKKENQLCEYHEGFDDTKDQLEKSSF